MANSPEPTPHYVSACVRVGDHEVTYLAAGPENAGEAVLLLHGFGAWSEVVWSSTIPALAARHRVVAPDLLGFGLSAKPSPSVFAASDPFAYEVEFLIEFLDALGLDRVAVVGSSFGGGLALRLATNHPERVSRLVLVASMGLGRSIHPVYKLLASSLFGSRIAQPDRARIRRMWSWVVHDPSLITDRIVDRNFELLSEPGAIEVIVAARYGVNIAGQKIVFYEDLPRIGQPTLIVWGREDRIFPARHATRAARLIPSAELVVFERCGHLPPFECPEVFNHVVAEFLARRRAVAATAREPGADPGAARRDGASVA